MQKLMLFGASGNLGKQIAKEAINQGFDLTIVVRSAVKAAELADITSNYIIADVTKEETLHEICDGYEVIVSALGKSVSPNEKSKATFREIDLEGNTNILDAAMKSKVVKFVYISAFHAEKYPSIEYFSVHHEFSEKLKSSGIDYSIIKPPAIFSGYIDMVEMARLGRLFNIGSGDKLTNPIFEGDLAKECIKSIDEQNATIDIGGATIYSRRQLNEIIQHEVNPSKRVHNFPLWLFKLSLPFIKLYDKNLYDKFHFFTAVIQQDTIAPQVGKMNFEDYIKSINSPL